MRGTLPQKIGRVVANLSRHPTYVSRCLRHNVLGTKTLLDLELPWFAYAAIDFLEKFIAPEMEVFEYGTGGSTLFFARRSRAVVSVENDGVWFERVQRRIKALKLKNVTLELRPFDFRHAEDFQHSAYLHALPRRPFDVLVIDGSEEWIPVRPLCFARAEMCVKAGGVIVVDDSWRYPMIQNQHHAKRRESFQSVGPGRPGVTSTDVFFY